MNKSPFLNRALLIFLTLATVFIAGAILLQAGVSPGACWLPRGLGYRTVEVGTPSQLYCVRVSLGGEIVQIVPSSDGSTFAYAFRREEPNASAITIDFPSSQGYEWSVVTLADRRVVRLAAVDGRDVVLSPDGSLVRAARPCESITCETFTYEVISASDGTKICEYTVTDGWFDDGCGSPVQRNGDAWNVQDEVNRSYCGFLHSQTMGLDDLRCADFPPSPLPSAVP